MLEFIGLDPFTLHLADVLLPPSPEYWLGTDSLGRDVFSRLVYGAGTSILVGLIAVGLSTVIGILVGAAAGMNRKADALLMRFVDVMLCFPSFFLILAVVAFLKPSLMNVMIVIGLTSWMGTARLVRAEFLKLQSQEFILAAKMQGTNNWRLMWHELLPNAMAPVYVNVTFAIAGAILTESALSFLGLGVQPPTPSWGQMLSEGKANLEVAWWLSLFPGLCILITVLLCNSLGEYLRRKFDPKHTKYSSAATV